MRHDHAVRMLLAIATLASAPAAAQAQCAPARDPRGGQWNIDNATVAASTTPTRDAIALVRGMACRADLAFDDGVIDFEAAPLHNGFLGVAFRMASAADYEIIYLRADSSGRWAQAQYQPVYQGETTWQLYERPGYLADLPSRVAATPDGWTHVRLVIAGSRADLYVGDDTLPALRARSLRRARMRGPVGIWAAGGSATTAANAAIRGFRVEPPIAATRFEFAPETASVSQLSRWHVSARHAAPDSTTFSERLSLRLRGEALNGNVVVADSSGLVNLTAALGNPAGRQRTNVFGGAGWGVAYVCAVVHSSRAQTRQLLVSYSDAIGVYLDGVRVYQGNNTYGVRGKGQLGTVGVESESVPLQLAPGDHEIVLAIADRAFGWGFRARLDSLDDIQLVP